MTMSPEFRERLGKVLGMTGSSHDGEVLAAVRRAQSIMAGAKLSWSDLLGAQPQQQGGRNFEDGFRAGFERGVAKGRVEGRAEATAAKAQERVAEPEGHAAGDANLFAKLRGLSEEAYGINLSDWERNFVEDVLGRGYYGFTEKQRSVVVRILLKNGIKP